jgi:hypothetical protein
LISITGIAPAPSGLRVVLVISKLYVTVFPAGGDFASKSVEILKPFAQQLLVKGPFVHAPSATRDVELAEEVVFVEETRMTLVEDDLTELSVDDLTELVEEALVDDVLVDDVLIDEDLTVEVFALGAFARLSSCITPSLGTAPASVREASHNQAAIVATNMLLGG